MENNNPNVRYCPYCGKAVAIDYVFCPVCGKSLPNGGFNNGQAAGYYPPGYNQPNYSQPNYTQPNFYPPVSYDQYVNIGDEIDGVPTAEIADYIGKNNKKLLPKFLKYSYGAKAGWNWPTFLFGLLLGVPFVWFFHRKMYKLGAIILAISFILGASLLTCTLAATVDAKPEIVEFIVEVQRLEDKYPEEIRLQNEEMMYEYTNELELLNLELSSNVASRDKVVSLSLAAQLIQYLHILFVLTTTILANYWYYKKTMSDLKALNANGYPDGYTVQALGGTKPLAAWLAGIGFFVVLIVIACVVLVPFLASVIREAKSIYGG